MSPACKGRADHVWGGVISADDVGVSALWVVHDVVDPACQCLYRASTCAGSGVANATSTGAILLVSDAHDGGSGCV